jgi:hypothetical protein
MYNEEMARSFLAMFLQLGQTESGSRALGESFVDFFEDALWAFVGWYAGITSEHVINDIVDWNWGEDEQAPRLVAAQDDSTPLLASDIANLVQSGTLVVDDELQGWIRKRFSMPDYVGGSPLPTKPGNESQEAPVAAALWVECTECGAADTGEPCRTERGRPLTWVHASRRVAAGGKPSKGTPKDKRLKQNKGAKITKAHGDHDQMAHGHRHTDECEHDGEPDVPPLAKVTFASATGNVKVVPPKG